jgi:hypothetical protein
VWACLDQAKSSEAAIASGTSNRYDSDTVVDHHETPQEGNGGSGSMAFAMDLYLKMKYGYDDDAEDMAKNEEDEENDAADERKKGKALKGLFFAVRGTLSVPTAEFRKLIKNNGGRLARCGTSDCTHLVLPDTAAKSCRFNEKTGYHVVNERWVRSQLPLEPVAADSPPRLPRQSFVPLFDFIDELIATDKEEGSISNLTKRCCHHPFFEQPFLIFYL